RIVDLDSKVADRALELGVSEQKLNGSKVFGPAVDQRCLRPPDGMRAIAGGIEPDFLKPVIDDSGVLSCAKVRRLANTAWEKEVLRLQSRPFDPRLKRLARRRRDFKLHRTLRLLLQYHRSSCNAITMAYIADAQAHEIAGAQFAVDAEVQ